MNDRLLASFRTGDDALVAVQTLIGDGIAPDRLDVLSPVPVEGLDACCSRAGRRCTRRTGGRAGRPGRRVRDAGWIATVRDPFVAGARPMNSMLAWVPVTLEATILFAAFATVGAFLAACRLPEPWHPALEVPGIEAASKDRFVVEVRAAHPEDAQRVQSRLAGLGAEWVRGR
ncbi:MAG: DUF3341 domain-containing protein [Myxococcota bacterium]